jgi:endoglucanase
MSPSITMHTPPTTGTAPRPPKGNFINALDANNFVKYDQLVQACLSTGTKCIIDIHNYARFNDEIIGQGGPTNAQFADLWAQIATMVSHSLIPEFSLLIFSSTKQSQI